LRLFGKKSLPNHAKVNLIFFSALNGREGIQRTAKQSIILTNIDLRNST